MSGFDLVLIHGANSERKAERKAKHALVSATVPDWSRENCASLNWSPARQLMRCIRDNQDATSKPGIVATLQAKSAVLRHRFWSAVTGADIPLSSHIEGGLLLPHPQGVVIHPDAKIGPNCALFQQVTIGTGPREGLPTLAGHVDVGPGAKILGGVRIGEHAQIGANAVVISDVPAGGVAVGIPAQVKRIRPVGQR